MGFLNDQIANLTVICNYLKSDLIKKQRAFKIGLISIFLVVFFLTMIENVISLSPLIFFRLVEETVSEADMIFIPKISSGYVQSSNNRFNRFIINKQNNTYEQFNFRMLDFDFIREKLQNISFLKGVTPRWMFMGNSTSYKNNTGNWALSNLILLDSDLENKIGMGRENIVKKLYLNECYVSKSLYKSLKLDEKNTKVNLVIKFSSLLKALRQVNIGQAFYYAFGRRNDNEDEEKVEEDINEPTIDDEVEDEYSDMGTYVRKIILSALEKFGISESINIKKSDIKNFISNYLKINTSEINITELKDFSIKKEYLDNPLIQSIPYFKNITDQIFSEEPNLINSILKYDKEKGIVKINEKIIDILNEFDSDDDDQEIEIPLNITNFLEKFNDTELDNIATIELDLNVVDIVKKDGKWPSASGNVIALDSNYFNSYLLSNLLRGFDIIAEKINNDMISRYLKQTIVSAVKNFNINKYALTVNAILKEKYEVYKLSPQQMRYKLTEQTKEILETLGNDFPVSINIPIVNSMVNVEMGMVFLENIFMIIMGFLWMLSVILVYTLMLGNVDERTYEFGMLRSLGFKKRNLIIMILLQGLIFAIPGLIFGLVTAYICNNYIGFLLNWHASIVIPYFLNTNTILFGVSIGISIPLISSYFPIKKCLDSNLKETLTLFNKSTGDLVVSMIKLENLGISPSALTSSLVLLIIGFSTYYLAPLSYILLKPGLFILIMMLILLTMLLGMIILVQLLVPSLEKLILEVIMIFAYKDRNIKMIVLKNLEGHQKRNKKVSLMFMIALGFIIFAGCTLNLIVAFIQTLSKSTLGGDIAVLYTNTKEDISLNEKIVDSFLKKVTNDNDNPIQNYSLYSFPLSTIIGYKSSTSAINGNPKITRDLYAIDESYVASGYSDLYQVTEFDDKLNYSIIEGKPDLISMLYKNPNIGKILNNKNDEINFPSDPNYEKYKLKDFQFNVIASDGLKYLMAIDVNNPAKIIINGRYKQNIPARIVGLSSKLPGSPSYSSYIALSRNAPFYTSFTQFKEFIQREIELNPKLKKRLDNSKSIKKTLDGIRKQGLYIKFKKNAKQADKERVYYELKNLLADDAAGTSFLDEIIQSSEEIKDIMEIIFLILGIIALILSFFLIWTSFYSNIKDNICEYGIIRSIGVNVKQSTRIYMYEAACIICSSVVTGTFIGVVISVTLILQFDMFAELPFVFNFPYKLYFSLVSFGVFIGMLGSYYPTYEVNHMSLIKIMKGYTE